MKVYSVTELWHETSGITKFRDSKIDPADLKKDELIIRSSFSLISSGTEKIILNHKQEGQMARNMRVPYMLGDFNSAFTYGYSLVGRVIHGPTDWEGKCVHVMHPHQNMAIVKQDDAYKIPNEVTPEQATLASNLETVINAVWDAGVSIGEKVLVIGFGIIGALLSTVLKRFPGIEVTVLEVDEVRKNLSQKLGFQAVSDPATLDKEYSVVYNTSASQSGLQLAVDKVSFEGTVIELSWYGTEEVALRLGDEFHYGRKKIISSQVSHIPASRSLRFNHRKRKSLAFNILQEIDFNGLLNRVIPFHEAPDWYGKIRSGKVSDIGILFQY